MRNHFSMIRHGAMEPGCRLNSRCRASLRRELRSWLLHLRLASVRPLSAAAISAKAARVTAGASRHLVTMLRASSCTAKSPSSAAVSAFRWPIANARKALGPSASSRSTRRAFSSAVGPLRVVRPGARYELRRSTWSTSASSTLCTSSPSPIGRTASSNSRGRLSSCWDRPAPGLASDSTCARVELRFVSGSAFMLSSRGACARVSSCAATCAGSASGELPNATGAYAIGLSAMAASISSIASKPMCKV
mmetsp:Transcript_44616/g.110609  ORF Transcript_44616/g.110609 Transcript_44616/m.110609 type:complete len:249 (-) Transcript_44616:26-772(-)